MCLDEKTSWITLAVGTTINICTLIYLFQKHSLNKKTVIPITILLWIQYALLMQIPDALSWRNPDSKWPGKMAFFLNITQPLIGVICVIYMLSFLDIPLTRAVPMIILLVLYFIVVISKIGSIRYDIKPKDNCRNLQYRWWEKIPAILYLIVMLIIFLTIPSFWYSSVLIALFLISLAITMIIVTRQCNPGSLWCWSVATSGLFIFITFLILSNQSKT